MSRRPVVAALTGVLLAFLAATLAAVPATGRPSAQVATDATKPNIVVITLDDMRADDLQWMPRTRALIGDQGVTFEHAYSSYPLCCPARSSFLTGQHAHNHEVWSHLEPYGFKTLRDAEALPVWLQDAGYDTVFFGKYLNGYGVQPAPDGSAADSRRYIPPGWSDWQGALDGGPGPGEPLAGGTYRFFNTTLNDNGTFALQPGVYQSDAFANLTETIVAEQAAADGPFFLWANYVAPHHGQPGEADDPAPITRDDGKVTDFQTTARPPRWRNTLDEELTVAPGAAGEDDVSDKPFFIRTLPPLNDAEQAGLLETARQRAEALGATDEAVARTITALEASGELDDTLVVLTSDNGYFLGEHRIRQGKTLPYEPALNVPLLVRGPGIPASEVRSDPFTTTDFAPTLLAAAGVDVDWPFDGVSLLEVARHGDQGWRRGVLTETGPRNVIANLDESGPPLQLRRGDRESLSYSTGVRTARYLYVEHADGFRELYDMESDPAQVRNVVDLPAYADDVAALAKYLRDLRLCKGGSCAKPLPRSLQAGP
ncbi:arylsulfatase A-like enzyme [Nocardioides thalensis]|uniref:Arylsulfatase A-like enzyme n=1 Tax=Nocardioides thalensis TaxID=1914755 RepID=A0A853CBL1_9ACTN|nr:sulfatase [Nocardioides thalensis]NYJ03573.1 arylsulfatase A-like enzyme [Nocardioides thalensis]